MENKIPTQMDGVKSDSVSTIEFENSDLAAAHFELVKKRFLDINSWQNFAGSEKAEFSLRDSEGNSISTLPEVGNYVAIKIPLLHNPAEEGYDWVKVEVCESEKAPDFESLYIRLRPAADPRKENGEIIHFLNKTSTSNFIISRENRKISAEIYARNEKPNTDDKNLMEKIRNKTVALGAQALGSKIQWKSLTDGFLKCEK